MERQDHKLESAIPTALKAAHRTEPRRVPGDDYNPPFPASVARFKPNVTQIVMAYLGVQYMGEIAPSTLQSVMTQLETSLRDANQPGKHERAFYIDEAGYTNIITIAYWEDHAVFDKWFKAHGAAWAGPTAVAHQGIGTFTEVLRPTIQRFETLFSSDIPEGVAQIADHLSGQIQEHAYWGGMRDRIPLSQTDKLAGSNDLPKVVTKGAHSSVAPHQNLCLIRSGQDWTQTKDSERRMYVEDVEPVLRSGMNFLRDKGLEIGCFANRFMTLLDAQGKPLDKTFGMSWWKSLRALEQWAESHPTHVAIFAAAMKYLGTLGPAAQLKLYHEVTVADASEQLFEYFNCHPSTGMLRCAPQEQHARL